MVVCVPVVVTVAVDWSCFYRGAVRSACKLSACLMLDSVVKKLLGLSCHGPSCFVDAPDLSLWRASVFYT